MTHPPSTAPPVVRFDPGRRALDIARLELTDDAIVNEARHWSSGQRGTAIDDETELAAADLEPFVREALTLGSRALAVLGEAADSRAVERLLHEVGERTAASTGQAAELTQRSARAAAEAIETVAKATRTSLTETEERTRTTMSGAVESATKAITAEIQRVLGGENPELVQRLRPLLDAFGHQIGEQARSAFDSFVQQAGKQLDPADPTSPMAKLATSLAEQQKTQNERFDARHAELAAALGELTTAVRIDREKSNVVQLTTLKGRPFEDAVGALLQEIAAGLGDEYEATHDTVGLLPRSKRGDGVLHVDGASAGVVVEMTDSPGRAWAPYLEDAERNRGVSTSLGVVRTPEQNGGQHVRVLGRRRVVLAFDPESDDPGLLRTVVQLLRAAAMAASGRNGAAEIATAEEHITAAIDQLGLLDTIKKAASAIQKRAGDIDGDCSKVAIGVQRHLDLATAALAGLGTESSATAESIPGVA